MWLIISILFIFSAALFATIFHNKLFPYSPGRIDEFKKEKNTKMLVYIATGRSPLGRCMLAAEGLAANADITELAKSAFHWQVRQHAIEITTSENVLIDSALRDKHIDNRKLAAKRIKGRVQLLRVARKTTDESILSDALKSVFRSLFGHGQTVLNENSAFTTFADYVAAQSENQRQAMLCDEDGFLNGFISSLQNKEVISRLAKNHPKQNVREASVKKLEDAQQLFEIAQNDTSLYVRKAALERISDQSHLIEIAAEASEIDIFKLAIQAFL